MGGAAIWVKTALKSGCVGRGLVSPTANLIIA
jgi:hypothetical protein